MTVLIFKKDTALSSKPDVHQAIAQNPECQKKLQQGYMHEATHEYTDKDGNTLFYKVRLKHPDTKDKWIRPVHFNGIKWVWEEPGFSGGLKPFYALHLIHKHPLAEIFFVEGENKADALNKKFAGWGCLDKYVATTTGSATSAGTADYSVLSKRRVSIWADYDEPGFTYRMKITQKLLAQNCEVLWVDVDALNMSPKEDAVDWLCQNPQASFNDIKNMVLIEPQVETNEATKKPLSGFLLSAQELANLTLPALEYIVHPFIAVQSLAMVFAKRGIGKTWFTLQLAISVALGKAFFAWDVPKPRGVLLIDGEMPISSLQYRIKQLCTDELPGLLSILPSEYLWRDGQSLNLNDEIDLERIDDLLEELESTGQAPELIIIDNLSSMTAGFDENGNSEMDTMLRWLLKLRSQGYAVVLVHHAGKNGDQRGGSRREDFLNTSIKLTEVSKSNGDNVDGASFNIEFVKLRGLRPTPDKLKVELVSGEQGGVKWKTEGAEILPAYYEALRIIRDCNPKSQAEIAKTLCISASAVSQQLTTARKNGLLEEGKLQLTKKGKAEIDKFFTDHIHDL